MVNFQVGDKVRVEDERGTLIYDRLIVRHVHDRSIVAVFRSGSGFVEKAPHAFTLGWREEKS